MRVEVDLIAVRRLALDSLDGPGEHPRMAAVERLGALGLQNDFGGGQGELRGSGRASSTRPDSTRHRASKTRPDLRESQALLNAADIGQRDRADRL